MANSDRAALKAATEKVSALEEQIKSLEAASERAATGVDDAEAELERYTHLDDELTRWRVAQVKKGASTKALPADLKARVDAKRAAIDDVEQAQSAQAAIREELDGLRVALAEAEGARTQAATDVLHEMGLKLGRELEKINRRRVELVQLLEGLSGVRVADGTGRTVPIGIVSAASNAIHFPFAFEFPTLADPVGEVTVRWTRRLDALCADPEAAVSIPRHLEPLDYVHGQAQPWEGPGHPFPAPTPGSWRTEEE